MAEVDDARISTSRGLTDWAKIIALEALVLALYDRTPDGNASTDNVEELVNQRMLHYGLEEESLRTLARDECEMYAARLRSGDCPLDRSLA